MMILYIGKLGDGQTSYSRMIGLKKNGYNIKTIDTTLRAILRAACAEFLNKKTPKKVIMSEYVSITGTFYPAGKEQKFINGLLNKIIEDLQT